MSETFTELDNFISAHENVRICILDNNNIQFCMHNKSYFPLEKIYEYYDIILIPGWVHAEIGQSDHRIQYIGEIPKPLFILDEARDYLPLTNFEDERLMNVFLYASPPSSKPRKYLKTYLSKLEEKKRRINAGEDIAIEEEMEEWIENYYRDGFDTKDTEQGELKKNAGEISILTLAFLMLHFYGSKIKNVTISSSDRGVIDIKRNILDYAGKNDLLNVPLSNPIGFLSTDVLLAKAFDLGTINENMLCDLRKNRKFVMCSTSHEDGSSHLIETVLDTPDFISIISGDNPYSIFF
ncbi:hypothetical protein KM927_27975 [Priestia megaterium]|uniref:hypothetical protein n=1 Tax=Priestia megaterium TaxID=1404 RepID=UPI001C22D167|nr:hypothetical protein [Priestia megaterium]MBU8757311.1 hypothetical protein [Priestia megaterium]